MNKEFDSEVAENILLDGKFGEEQPARREKLTRGFYEQGGSPWDALRLLKLYPKDIAALESAYAFHLEVRDPKEAEEASTDNSVQNLLEGFSEYNEAELLERRKKLFNIIESEPSFKLELRPTIIALNIALRKLSAQGAQHVLLLFRSGDGFRIWVYGRPFLTRSAWAGIRRMAGGFLKASVLAKRQPPLQIRIIIHDRKSRNIASTHAAGNLITVNIEKYQMTEFSTGQMLGLLAHELGVHTLADLTLTPNEREAEDKDKETEQEGKVGGKTYKVFKNPKAEGQQQDHLTIGKAILGQSSAKPRLEVYEKTMISLIEAQEGSLKDQRETAAAYCIDIARIVVLNDMPPAGWSTGLLSINEIINVALAEWARIQETHPKLRKIKLNKFYILSALVKLGKLVFSLRGKESYL